MNLTVISMSFGDIGEQLHAFCDLLTVGVGLPCRSSDDGTCRLWDARNSQFSPRIFVPKPSDTVAGI